jgi:hypothetical protein
VAGDGRLFDYSDHPTTPGLPAVSGDVVLIRYGAHRGQSTAPRPGRAVPAGGHIVVFGKDGITGYR